MSLVTGGHFHRFYVTDGGGLCVTSGGNRKTVVAAGYIGTIMLGAICVARSVHGDSLIALQVLAILLALATLKAGDLQTVAVGIGVAGMLSLVGAFLPGAVVTRLLLNLMGVVLARVQITSGVIQPQSDLWFLAPNGFLGNSHQQ